MLVELRIRDLGVIEDAVAGAGAGHDRPDRRDRGRQDDARSRPSSCWSAGGPTPWWCARGADEAVRRGPVRRADGAGDDEVVVCRVVPRDGPQPGLRQRAAGAGVVAGRAGRRAGRPPRPARPPVAAGHRGPAPDGPRPLRWRRPRRRPQGRPGAELADVEARPAPRRRRAGPGPGDRPAAVPGRRARRPPRSTRPTRTPTLTGPRRTPWPTPCAHQEAAAAASRGPARRRPGPATPSGPPCRRSPGGAVRGALETRLRGLAAELDDRRRRAAAVGGSIEDDPAPVAAVRKRRQLLHDLRRKYGETLEGGHRLRRRVDAEPSCRAARPRSPGRRASTAPGAGGSRGRRPGRAKAVAKARRAAAPSAGVGRAGATWWSWPCRRPPSTWPWATSPGRRRGVPARRQPRERRPRPWPRWPRAASWPGPCCAVRLVLLGPRTGRPPTLVFDEVDAGIGGAAALVAGGLSAPWRAGERQVLVVTPPRPGGGVGRHPGGHRQDRRRRGHHVEGDGGGRRRPGRRAVPDAVGHPDSAATREAAAELGDRPNQAPTGSGRSNWQAVAAPSLSGLPVRRSPQNRVSTRA